MMTSAGGNDGTWLRDDIETPRSKQLNERRAGGSPLLDDGVRASSCSRRKDSNAGGRGVFVLGVFYCPAGAVHGEPVRLARSVGASRVLNGQGNTTWNQRAESDASKKVSQRAEACNGGKGKREGHKQWRTDGLGVVNMCPESC